MPGNGGGIVRPVGVHLQDVVGAVGEARKAGDVRGREAPFRSRQELHATRLAARGGGGDVGCAVRRRVIDDQYVKRARAFGDELVDQWTKRSGFCRSV